MTAARIAAALRGRGVGRSWMACCPAHEDRTPSLSLRDGEDGKVLVRCFAGCAQAEVIGALRARGLWLDYGERSVSSRAVSRFTPSTRPASGSARDEFEHHEAAFAIWRRTRPAAGSLVEAYLATRGLRILIPPTLRFHPGLRHPSGGVWPAILGLVTRGTDNVPLAIHRTFLALDGRAKAPVDPPKMMLGPCAGGAVRLADCGEHLAVAEGIETALSVIAATGVPTWAALSAGGIRSLRLPPLPLATIVTIAADPDPTGMAAAYAAARRWDAEGRQVRIAPPPAGSDYNDLLRASA